MRKTSHDGGDSTSITSGVENETKKSAMKPKKSSLKRKAANFSHDSDDTVIEPLLQKDRDKSDSSKYNTKGKTDTAYDKGNDKYKQSNDNKTKSTPTTGFCGTTESLLSTKEYEVIKSTVCNVTAPLHNYMNTNIFNTHENSKPSITTKSQILVEIDGTKQSGYSPSPLIFTTAKIHTDGKSKHMEPVQVTPVPILSTIEVSVSKGGSIISTNEKNKVGNGTSVVKPAYSNSMPYDKIKDEKVSGNHLVITTTTTTDTDKDSTNMEANAAKSVNKMLNITAVQSTDEYISSLGSKPVSTLSNSKDKPSTSKLIQIEQIPELFSKPQSTSLNMDGSKSNVSVKAPSLLSEKNNTTGGGQGEVQVDKFLIEKRNSDKNTELMNTKSKETHKNTKSDLKSPVSSKSSIKDTKTTGSLGANKQLQRQKTLSDDMSIISDAKLIQNTENPSAKILPSTKISSTSKVNDLIKDGKSPKSSANTQNISSKTLSTTATITSKSTSLSKSTKPTNVSSHSNTEPSNIPIKPSSLPVSGNDASVPISTANIMINKISTVDAATTGSSNLKTLSSKSTSKPTTEKSAQSSSINPSKIVATKTPSNIAKAISPISDSSKDASVTSVKSIATASMTVTTKASPLTTNKTICTNTSVTTSIKTLPVTSVSNRFTNSGKIPIDITTTKIELNKKQPVSTISSIAAIPSPSGTTLENIDNTISSQLSSMKQSTTSSSKNAHNKPIFTTSTKTPSIHSTTPSVKLSQINSSQKSTITKPAHSLSGNITHNIVTNSSKPVSSGSTASTVKITQDTKKNTIESTGKASISKTATGATKASPVVSGPTKNSSSVVKPPLQTSSSTATPSAPLSGKTVSTKIPLSSSSSSTTVSDATKKPKVVDTVQTSTKKSEETPFSATSSTHSVNPPPKVSDTSQKIGSKTNEPKKDVKVSKA